MATILIVDDSEELLEFLEVLLTRNNYAVVKANCKEQLNERISLVRPDLILLDVWLDDQDGRLICKEIKSKPAYEYIPILLLSADPHSLKGFEECKASDVIEKPFKIVTLLDKIKAQLRGQQF